MVYSVGKLKIAFEGSGRVADEIRGLFELVKSEGMADLVFEFRDGLVGWGNDEVYSRLGDYLIGSERFRFKDRRFVCDVSVGKVLVEQRRLGGHKDFLLRLRKDWRFMHTHGRGGYLHFVKRFIFYVYMPLVELALLRKGCTFAHSSAIEKDGDVVMFSAWGGVGKTGIMSMYLERGWNFISDDFCVVDSDGELSIHPLPMHIYKYHQIHCPQLTERLFEQASAGDKMLWKALAPFKKPGRIVRWVGPEKVFGQEKLSNAGKVKTVVQMYRRQNLNDFNLREVEADELGRMMTNTVFDEINGLAEMSIAINSCGAMELVPELGAMYEGITRVFKQAFAGAKCRVVEIPVGAGVEDIYHFLEDNRLVV